MKLEYLPESENIKIIPEERYEYLAVKKWFARRPEGYMFDTRFKMKWWDGFNHGFDKETDTIPMGLWREVWKMCEELGYPFNFVNKEEFPINRKVKKSEAIAWFREFLNDNSMDEREYQLRVAASILKDRYCNIAVATSGGKTFIYSLVVFWLMAHGHSNKKFLLVVPSKTLVAQFYDDLLKYNNGKFDLNIQEIFDEGEDPRITNPDKEPNIIIGTFQSLAGETKIKDKNGKLTTKVSLKYPKEWFKQFFSITVDEGHKSKSASYKKILKSTFCNAYYRWGMSGTFYKDDTEEMMQIMMLTGPVIEVVKAKELMDKGYIAKVKIKGVVLNHNDFVFAENLYNVSTRDKKVCYDLECAKIQESEERLVIINKIVAQCKANTLVLFHNTEYGEKLFEYLKERNPDKTFHYIDGSIKNKDRMPIKEDMEKTDIVRILIASFGVFSTGVSINAITNILLTQSFKKSQIVIQSIGRALRLHPDKVFAYIFDIIDRFNVDEDSKDYYLKKFENVLYGHGKLRQKIYLEEEYPYTEMEFNLDW